MSKKSRKSGKRQSGPKGPTTAQHRAEVPVAEARSASVPRRGPHPLDNWLLGLAGAGILLTLYLTFTAWFGERPAFCGAGSQCDLVQQSRWSTLLGLPIAFWGFATYALLARLLWRLRNRPSVWRMALLVAVVGAAVSWYLTAISLFVIEARCLYCLTSFGIMNALLVLLLVRRPAHMPEHTWKNALPTPVAAAVVLSVALALHFSGLFDPAAGPEKPQLKALAVHLRDSGALFYGTYWCPSCQQQKELFGASAKRLPFIECTPNGRAGQPNFQCVANDIQSYPTWIIDGRRYTGVIPVDQLRRLSNFTEGAAPAK